MSDDARGTESDSETEIEYTVYEKRREVNVRKIVLLERLFSIAKQRLYHERLRQLETRQVELLNQTAADYINKKAVLLDEHRARSEYNTAFRTLQMESLRRKMVGKLETAHKNLIHNKKMAFERIEGEIKGRIAQMEKERKRCLDVIEQFALEGKEHPKRRKTDDETLENLRRELDMPLVFYMLPKEQFLMDITLVEDAMKAVTL
ncbi:unnamed protein product [Toxocara canis]|uniref:Meiosis-specific nuclear structural protein 1 n=1 Tax=Toxocara canis TaxID=6265 RepID=A0A183V6B5_TOXCA|nr:unnamed protein product [Toxocara canis]